MATALQNTGPAHLVEEGTGFPFPPKGLKVVGGHTLVAFTGQKAASEGSYAYGVGLFSAPEGAYHNYVVWTLILKPEGEWVVEAGNYVETLGAALERYEARGGKKG